MIKTDEEKIKELNADFWELHLMMKNWGKPKPEELKAEAIQEAVSRFNPDTDVIVHKSEVDIANQLKAIAAMTSKIEQIQIKNDNIESKVIEVHAAQLGKLTKPLPVRRSTKKEKEEAERAYLQSLRANAHLKIANGLYEVK